MNPSKTLERDVCSRKGVGPVRVLELLASAFINTFGITQPTDQTRRRAAWFIAGLLVLVLGAAATAAVIAFEVTHR